MTPTETQQQTTHSPLPPTDTSNETRLGKVKLGFLYVLIGGLVVSALISVTAILIGEFNSVIQKALLTTFSLVLHSCVALLIVLADKKDQLGKTLIPSTILATVIASTITTSLGIWDILGDNLAGRMVSIYALAIGTAFIVAGILRLRLAYKPVNILTEVSAFLMILLSISLVPWVLFYESLASNDFYYRLVSALAILTVTSVIITSILNRIAVAQKPMLSATAPKGNGYPGGMLAVLIVFGCIIALFWLGGAGSFIYSAVSPHNPNSSYDSYRYDSDYYEDDYDYLNN